MRTDELEHDIPYVDVDAPVSEIRRARDAAAQKIDRFTAVVSAARRNFYWMWALTLLLILAGLLLIGKAISSGWFGITAVLIGSFFLSSLIVVGLGTRYLYQELDVLRSRLEVFKHYIEILSEISGQGTPGGSDRALATSF